MIVIVEPIPIGFVLHLSNIAYTIMYMTYLGLLLWNTVSKTWNERIDVIVTTKTWVGPSIGQVTSLNLSRNFLRHQFQQLYKDLLEQKSNLPDKEPC